MNDDLFLAGHRMEQAARTGEWCGERGTLWDETLQLTTNRTCREWPILGFRVANSQVSSHFRSHNPWVAGSIPARPTRSDVFSG